MFVTTSNQEGYASRAGLGWNFINRSAPVHNAYLLARAETTWIGEIAFILLLFVPFWKGLTFAFRQRNGAWGEVALGSAAALGVNAIHNNWEYAVISYNVLAVIIINIGLIAAVIRAAHRVPARNTTTRRQATLSPRFANARVRL